MSALAPRIGAVVLAPSQADSLGDGGALLRRVLVERFAARVVLVPKRQMASPNHTRRALSTAVQNLADVDVVILAIAGRVSHFVRRSGDVISLALPGSLPGRPGSMVPLADLIEMATRRPETRAVVCVDLLGPVRPAQVVDVLSGVSVLVAGESAGGSACHDAVAAALAQTATPRLLADILQEAALLVGEDHAVLVQDDVRTVQLTPVARADCLPRFVIEDMAAPDPGSRLDAVSELAELADSELTALTHLRRLALGDPDGTVRDFARRRLHRVRRPLLPDLVKRGLLPGGVVDAAVSCPDLPELLEQPGGRVPIGVDAPAGDASCRPRHHVEVAPYRLGRTVVTNRQYLAFVAVTGHPCPDHWAAGGDLWSGANLPVVMVSQQDADDYCAWLTGRLHATGSLSASWRVRLPSEVEWEAAAGNGSGDPYPWGTVWQPTAANTRAAGIGAVVAVGRFPAGVNATGCQDLIGNVWEWTRSRWGQGGRTPAFGYPYRADDGRETGVTPHRGMRFVVRGGAFYYATECANSYTRNRMHATARHPAGGFRVAADRTEGAAA